MAEAVLSTAKHWTYTDYYHLDDGQRYEVIKGELIMTPAPFFKHQRMVTRLTLLLANYVNDRKTGEVVVAPVDVVLSDDIVLQPDIIFISGENSGVVKDAGIFGPPDLVVEILSPTSVYRDIQVKKGIYEKFGIKEYWIVFPEEKVIEVFSLDKGKYELFSSMEKTGKIRSAVLSAELDVTEVF